MQGDIRLRGAVAVEDLHLLGFGCHMLAALSQEGLLGRGGGQMWPHLLRHQLLLDFIDQD